MESIPSSLHKGGRKAGNSVEPLQFKDIATINSAHLNLYSFLSVAQQYGLEFMPITWDPARESLGAGISGRVNQSLIDVETSLAFKRPSNYSPNETSRQQIFRAWLLEIAILRSPAIQRHPNIIDLEGIAWEIGGSSTFLPVLVYRKSQLGSLRKYVEARGSSLSFDQRLRVCGDLASGLSTLHSCNIIHGDIKPENIVVYSRSADSDDANIKLIDFGCSSYGLEDQELVHITGTPLWSAPENNSGEATLAEAKKMDIYSFGLVCLWILCFDHQLPEISAENKQDMSIGGTKTARWTRRFVELIGSVGDLGKLIPQLLKPICPLEASKYDILEKIFVRTLCKDPKNRPHDWSEYTMLLGQLCDMSPSSVPFEGRALHKIEPNTCNFHLLGSLVDFEIADFRVRKYVVEGLEYAMNSRLCSTCSENAAFELALCRKIGFGGLESDVSVDSLLVSSNRTIEDLDEEIALFCEAQQSGLSPHLRNLVVGYSLDLPYAYQRADCLGVAELESEKEINQRLTLVSSDHPSIVRLRYALGHIYEALERWNKAEEVYILVRNAREKALGPDAHSTLIAEVKIASCMINQGQVERGQDVMSCSLHKLKTLKGEYHKSTIATMGHLASVYMKQGRFNDAGALLDQQMTLCKESAGETHANTLTILLNMALNQLSAGEWQKAEETSLRAIKMQQEVLGYDDREVLTGMHLHCRTLIEQGQYSQAKTIYQQEMRVYQKARKCESLGALLARDNLGLVLSGQGKLKDAIMVAEPAVDAMEKLMGQTYPQTIVMRSNLARLYLQDGSFGNARRVQEQVITSMKLVPNLLQMESAGLIAGLADILVVLNQWDMAETNYLEALELAKTYYGIEHPWTLYIRGSLATLYNVQSRCEEARKIGQDVLRLMRKDPGPCHKQTLKAMRNLSDTYIHLGDLREAKNLQDDLQSLRPPSSTESEILDDKLNLSHILYGLEQYPEAQTVQEEVYERLRILKGEDHPVTLDVRLDLAKTYTMLRHYEEAERIQTQDLPRHIRLYSKHHNLTLQSMSESARLSARQGRHDVAERQYEEVSRTWVEMGLQSHPAALKARVGIALAQLEQGNVDDSNETLKGLRHEAEEGKIQIQGSLVDEIDTVFWLIIKAKMPPSLLNMLEQLVSSEMNGPASSAPSTQP